MKRRIGLFSIALLVLFLSIRPCPSAAAAGTSDIDSRIQSEKSRLDAIEKQIQYHQRQISEARKKEKGLLDDLARINQDVVLLRQKISLLDLRIEKTEIRIEELDSEISTTEASLGKTKSYLSARFEAIYKYGGVAEFNLMLSAANTHEAMNNAFLLGRIAREDERKILELTENRKRLELARLEMGEQKVILDEQRNAIRSRRMMIMRASRIFGMKTRVLIHGIKASVTGTPSSAETASYSNSLHQTQQVQIMPPSLFITTRASFLTIHSMIFIPETFLQV